MLKKQKQNNSKKNYIAKGRHWCCDNVHLYVKLTDIGVGDPAAFSMRKKIHIM